MRAVGPTVCMLALSNAGGGAVKQTRSIGSTKGVFLWFFTRNDTVRLRSGRESPWLIPCESPCVASDWLRHPHPYGSANSLL